MKPYLAALVLALSGCAVFPDCVGTPFCTNHTVVSPDYGVHQHPPHNAHPHRGRR